MQGGEFAVQCLRSLKHFQAVPDPVLSPDSGYALFGDNSLGPFLITVHAGWKMVSEVAAPRCTRHQKTL